MAEQTKKRSMTADSTPKICENPKKKKSDTQMKPNSPKWKVWSHNYHVPPLGAAKEHQGSFNFFQFTMVKNLKYMLFKVTK